MDMGTEPSRVLIVGGGLAGLVAAYRILQAQPSAQVTVLDAGDRPGGKLRLEPVAGVPIDVGAESMLARRPEAMRLVADLEAEHLVVHPDTTSPLVWSRGRLETLPAGTLMGVPSQPESALGLLTPDEVARALDEQWADPLGNGDVSVGEYVAARLGPAVVDRIVEPLLGGVYAGRSRDLSLHATVPTLWEAASRGDSLTARAQSAAAAAQADPTPVFAGLSGGVGRLPALLVGAIEGLGGTISSRVIGRELHQLANGSWSVVTGPRPAPRAIVADAVVLATPAPAAARLLSGVAPTAATDLAAVEYASMAIVTLAVDRSARALFTSSGFLVPPVDGRTIKASTFSSRKWAWAGEATPEAVFLRASIGRAGEVADLQRDDDELVAIAVAEVGHALGQPLPRLVDSHVQRWGGGLPQYAVGHLARVERVGSGVAPLAGLALAGAAYSGVGIPAVIASAEAAASAVVTHLQRRASVARQ
jgi:protoporphyrinogen/coproporphyrinogen III oxidase